MWERIQIESSLIETSTDSSVLINMPSKSEYKGFSFWHPAKCCRSIGKSAYLLQISFTKDFKFTLKKYGKGKFNWAQVLKEKTIDSEELKSAFGFGVDEELYKELSDE